MNHDDAMKWKHFSRYWQFVRGIPRSPVNSPHKGQCRRALMFSLICVWINGWVNNREAGDITRHRTHHDVIVMFHINVESVQNDIMTEYTLNDDQYRHNDHNMYSYLFIYELRMLISYRLIDSYDPPLVIWQHSGEYKLIFGHREYNSRQKYFAWTNL